MKIEKQKSGRIKVSVHGGWYREDARILCYYDHGPVRIFDGNVNYLYMGNWR